MMSNLIKVLMYLALLIIMMPVFKPFDLNIAYSDILIIATFMIILISRGTKIQLNFYEDIHSDIIYFIGVLLFFIGFSISSIINGSSNYLTIISQYFMLLIIVPLTIKNSNIKLKKALVMIMISMTITIMFGTYIYYFTSNATYSIGGRMGSLFKNPNTLAKNISLLIPIIFILNYKYKIKIAWLFIPVFILGLMLSSSFGGIIASITSLIIVLFFYGKLKDMMKIILILIISSLLIVNFFGIPEIFEERILETQSDLEKVGSYTIKKDLMNDSIEIISDNPFIGLGLGNYLYNSNTESTVHNTYLLIWTEGGLLSLIGFLMILLSFLIKIIKNYGYKNFFATSITVLIIIILNFMTNVHFYNRYGLIALFLLLILFNQKTQKKLATI